MMIRFRRLDRMLVMGLVCAGLALSGCTQKLSNDGMVMVSPLSATDWHRYRDELQPHFTLKEDDALKKAVPLTGQFEQSILESISTAIKLKFTGADELVDAGDAEAKAPKSPPAAEAILDKKEIEIDPRLQYLIATALWQEVQMLNRYVKDAIVNDDTHAYLVRFRLTNMPAHRNAAYDAYVDLDFSKDKYVKRVVPLLISDHVESALVSRRNEELERFAFALSAMFQGLGVSGDYEAMRGELNRSLLREYNSLLTVGQVDPKKLQARIGARRVGDGQYSASPEPHTVTVLVLVKKTTVTDASADATDFAEESDKDTTLFNIIGSPDKSQDLTAYLEDERKVNSQEISFTYSTTLRNSITGVVIGSPTPKSTVSSFSIPTPVRSWVKSVQTALGIDDGSTTSFTLNGVEGFYPSQLNPTWLFRAGDSKTIHALSAGKTTYDPDARQLKMEFPSLKQFGLKNIRTPKNIPKYLQDRNMSSAIADAAIEDRTAWNPSPERSFIVRLRNRDKDLYFPWVYAVKNAPAPKPIPGFKAVTRRTVLVPKNGIDTIKVDILLPIDKQKKPIAGFSLVVMGADADIVNTAPDGMAAPPVSGPQSKLIFKASGTLTLNLHGLHAGGEVKLIFKAPKGYASAEDITLTVKSDAKKAGSSTDPGNKGV